MKNKSLQNLNKVEQRLVKAATFGVPASMMGSYIEFLAEQREKNQIDLNKAESEFKTAEELYNGAKATFTEFKTKQDDLDNAYKLALAFKENPKTANKQFTFYAPDDTKQPESAFTKSTLALSAPKGSTTVNQKGELQKPEKKEKERGVRSYNDLRWNEMAEAVLREHNAFVDPKALVALIVKKDAKYGSVKPITQAGNFLRTAQNPPKRKAQILSFYQGKIGLTVWMNGDVPKAEYLPGFMFNTNTASEIITSKTITHDQVGTFAEVVS